MMERSRSLRGEAGMAISNDTMPFTPISERDDSAEDIIMRVYQALKAKGYDPITQIVGFLISGDPTYITNHNGARSLICRLERDEIMEELVQAYIEARER
jgi:uncharacterized protein (UPF0297 family)